MLLMVRCNKWMTVREMLPQVGCGAFVLADVIYGTVKQCERPHEGKFGHFLGME